MAFRTWVRLLGATLGVAALAGACQLGVAYGLGILRLTRVLDVTTRDQWTAQLTWVAWFAMMAAVIGGFAGSWFLPRWSPTRPGTGTAVAIAVAAGIGAAVVVPLTMQPARTAQIAGVHPVFVIGLCAGLGALTGTVAAVAALLQPVARASLAALGCAVWLIAIVSVAPSLSPDDPLPAVRLGVFDAGFLSPAVTQRTALFTMPALALIAGALLGWAARRLRKPMLTIALAGLPGAALLTASYLIAGPGSGADRYQVVPYWAAMTATGAGVLGSVLAAVVRRGGPDDGDERQQATEDRPPLPHRAARSEEDTGVLDGVGSSSPDHSATPTSPAAGLPPASDTPAAPLSGISPLGPAGASPLSDPAGASRHGGPAGASRHGGPAGASPLGGPAGASPLGGPAGASRHGGPAGASPLGGPAGASPLGGPAGASPLAGPPTEPTLGAPISGPTPSTPFFGPSPSTPITDPAPSTPITDPAPSTPITDPAPSTPPISGPVPGVAFSGDALPGDPAPVPRRPHRWGRRSSAADAFTTRSGEWPTRRPQTLGDNTPTDPDRPGTSSAASPGPFPGRLAPGEHASPGTAPFDRAAAGSPPFESPQPAGQHAADAEPYVPEPAIRPLPPGVAQAEPPARAAGSRLGRTLRPFSRGHAEPATADRPGRHDAEALSARPSTHASNGPETAPSPSAAHGPEAAPSPSAAHGPEAAPSPSAAHGPEAAPSPSAAHGPEAAPSPSAAHGPEAAPSPSESNDPEAAPESAGRKRRGWLRGRSKDRAGVDPATTEDQPPVAGKPAFSDLIGSSEDRRGTRPSEPIRAFAGEPGAGMPEARMPEARMPEARMPEARMPEARMPEARMPEARMPEAGMPEAGMPGTPFGDDRGRAAPAPLPLFGNDRGPAGDRDAPSLPLYSNDRNPAAAFGSAPADIPQPDSTPTAGRFGSPVPDRGPVRDDRVPERPAKPEPQSISPPLPEPQPVTPPIPTPEPATPPPTGSRRAAKKRRNDEEFVDWVSGLGGNDG
jgi:hypothetical protein